MSCPDCLRGHVRDGTPTGKVAQIHGRATYVAEPPSGTQPKGVVVMVSDIFGWDFVNSRLLADHYAASGGFLVYLPDFMDGTGIPSWLTDVLPKAMSSKTIGDWLWKPWYMSQIAFYVVPWMISNRFGVSWPKVRSFFEAVRHDEGSRLSVGAAGFCWGGKHSVVLTHAESITDDGKPLVDAIFIAHPSVLKYPDDYQKVTKPASMAIGDKDMTVTMEQVALVQKTWGDMPDVDTEVVVYPGANHGFAVRVDPFNENLLRQCREAEDQAVAWFSKYLK
ncbi:Alpha/Beta hydrolase protein [Cercophora scortea]|uniref:Alpha/Beta hydrolase protein n=1 Tax=Cercophora scortea TaxID=314031 RepID=A0AAE0J2A6_9PEZI|nr:Alpha/Beta hydrolase protein [Cercophora scortea]